MARKNIPTHWNRDNRNAINDNFIELYQEVGNIVGNITDEVYEKIIDGSKLSWKEPVDSIDDLPTSATEGDTRMARDTGKVYRYNGSEWKEIQQIDAGPVNELDSRLSSQLAETATKDKLGRVKVDGDTIISNNDGVISTKNNTLPVNTPSGFSYKDHPLKGKIYTDGKGNFKIKGFDVSKLQPFGKTYYVDVNNGDDENDGLTLNTAFKKLPTAVNKSDSVVIMVAEGVYNRTNGLSDTNPITTDKTIKAINGHNVIFASTQGISWSKTPGQENVYQSETGNANMILDTRYIDNDGDFSRLTKVNSVQRVVDNAGTYYHDGSTVYIHAYGSREPDSYIWRFTGSSQLRIQGGATVYLEGVQILEGSTPVSVEKTEENLTPKFYAKNCEFKFSGFTSTNIVDIRGAESILQNCVAAKGTKDGFYYTQKMGQPAYGLEIDCIGRQNGVDTDGSDQGSTIHTTCKIIRINGVYYGNKGANVGDDGDKAESWNLGCISYDSESPNSSQNAGFMAYEGVNMWLDGCLSYQSEYDLQGDGTIFIRNNNLLSPITQADRTTVEEY